MSVRQTILDGILALGAVAVIVANRPGTPSNAYNPSPNAYYTAYSSQDTRTPPIRDYAWDGEGWVVR